MIICREKTDGLSVEEDSTLDILAVIGIIYRIFSEAFLEIALEIAQKLDQYLQNVKVSVLSIERFVLVA